MALEFGASSFSPSPQRPCSISVFSLPSAAQQRFRLFKKLDSISRPSVRATKKPETQRQEYFKGALEFMEEMGVGGCWIPEIG